MQRRNLDLYLGTITRARSREKGDIHFTTGYLAFESKLLTNSQQGITAIGTLNDEEKVIGALENSPNEWLAEEIGRASCRERV